jgi:hypothetical protein
LYDRAFGGDYHQAAGSIKPPAPRVTYLQVFKIFVRTSRVISIVLPTASLLLRVGDSALPPAIALSQVLSALTKKSGSRFP